MCATIRGKLEKKSLENSIMWRIKFLFFTFSFIVPPLTKLLFLSMSVFSPNLLCFIETCLPEQACGGSGNMRVVEDLRRATAQPSDWGLKLRSCCMKSLHSMSATSAKCRSHRIWFLKRRARFWEQQCTIYITTCVFAIFVCGFISLLQKSKVTKI